MYNQALLWFYTKTPEETGAENDIMRVALGNCKVSAGVYWFSVPWVAAILNLSPFDILTVLQKMQQ